MDEMYEIVRFYRDDKPSRVISKNLTLEQVQEHCRSSSSHHIDKEGNIDWFDGYRRM